MNTLLVLAFLLVCAHAQAFDVRRLHPTGGQRLPVPRVKKDIQSRALENGHKSSNPKISGGTSAKLGQIPFQVSIESESTRFCGGAIIHPFYVITSGDCVFGGTTFTIYAGVVKLRGDESSRVIVQSTDATIHEDYNEITQAGNIAILKLSEELHFNEYISPALLPTDDDTYVNDAAWISGWGAFYDGGSLAPVLQYGPVTVISNDECVKVYTNVIDSVICAHSDSGVSGISGDGGGPLYKEFTKTGQSLLIGLDVFGSEDGLEGYTRISSYRDWIVNKLQESRS